MMIKKLLRIFGLFLFILIGAFFIWAETPSPAEPVAIQALASDSQVTVTREQGWYVFSPAGRTQVTGFIFYPGGHVDEKAYALPLRQIAAEGTLVVLAPMPLNLAVFKITEAGKIIQAFPQIKSWAIGGHSLGGAMAANYAVQYPDQVSGLILWASYPAESDDLSSSGMKVLSIFGTLDGEAGKGVFDSSRIRLPADTTWLVIEGGNHAQFGNYGSQNGDQPAEISSEEQQQQAIQATVAFLEQLH